jgi:hypothetical protein
MAGGGFRVVSSLYRMGLLALSCALGACAIHPLPEDVIGVKTAAIVHRIRCEAREAVTQVHPRHQKNLQTLKQIGIAYSFSLQGMETDSLMAMATFEKPLSNGMKTINPAVGDSLVRNNTRTFTVLDNYQSLMQMQKCGAEPIGPNYQYPIVGTIGIREMIHTFINLALHDELAGEEGNAVEPTDDLNSSAIGPPTMVDTITFTTTLNASATPTIILMPVTAAAQLTNASVTGTLMRQDVHEVIVGLGLPSQPSSRATVAQFARSQYGAVISASPMLISANPRTSGEAAALNAVNNQILRYELPRSVIVVP